LALIDDVKSALRISNTAYNTEIADLILAAKSDLGICGLLTSSETDPLIKRAIITYCKANFGWDNPDSEKLQRSYDLLKNHISLSADYAYFSVTFTVKNNSDVAIRSAEVTFNGEIKTTSASGVAIFYVRAGNNYEYTVTADDYLSDDDDDNLIDVSASTSVSIILTGA
jgi:hypothetical protein